MGTKERGRAADRAGRPPMQSPGRPPVWRREHKQLFWEAIGLGLSSEDASAVASVSSAVGVRWFREGGGMSSARTASLSGRYLSFGEREEIAILHAQDCGVREIARRVSRSPSTISRELLRNAATRGGSFRYRATTAQWHADRRAKRPKVAKLAIGFQRRFLPAWVKAKELIGQGAIGRPERILHTRRTGLLNATSHGLDCMRYILGDPGSGVGFCPGGAQDRSLRAQCALRGLCGRIPAFCRRGAGQFPDRPGRGGQVGPGPGQRGASGLR